MVQLDKRALHSCNTAPPEVSGRLKMSSAKQANTNTCEFAFCIGESVSVELKGRVIERKEGDHGNSYWIEQTLPNGQTARQWFKEVNVFEADNK